MYSDHVKNKFGAKNKAETVFDQINKISEQVKQGRLFDILEDIERLPSDNQGRAFRFDERIRNDDKQHIPGEAGLTYPCFEVALEYSREMGEQYDDNKKLGFSRSPRTSFLFSAEYKQDQITNSLNYTGSKTIQVRYDSMHVSTSPSSITSHEFDVYKTNDELDIAKGIYEFFKELAPDRAEQVKRIINNHYNGAFQPETTPKLQHIDTHKEWQSQMSSML